jgi:hypothetical protein
MIQFLSARKHFYKYILVNVVQENYSCLLLDHIKPIRMFYGQTAELMDVTVSGAYSYHSALKSLRVKQLSE